MKIALVGYGKMGKAIEESAVASGHEINLKISSTNRQELTIDAIKGCDVAIEFTNPQSAANNIKFCIDAGVPVVSGSTGWLQQLEDVRQYCIIKNGCFLYASNFSIGVNILFEINKRLAGIMKKFPGYKPSIEEIHHTQKKDSPSGTAITLAEQILSENPDLKGWNNDEARADQILITSKRIDPAPGTHHVLYSSSIDDLQISHTAHNRKGFADGAVAAAGYVIGKTGIFSMNDVLGL